MDRRAFCYLAAAVTADAGARLLDPFDTFTCSLIAPLKKRRDIFFEAREYASAYSLYMRLRRLQSVVGYGNFNIIDFDYALTIGRHYTNVGEFRDDEIEVFEKLFYFNADEYGFFGEKVITDMTVRFDRNKMYKVPHTGHFLYKSESLGHYETIRKKIGGSIILTSGVRGIVKQMYLFLNKTFQLNGNLSLASHSLAPAGYSYHGVGDFDVGKVGFGVKNFTREFENTDEFKRLMDLGFVKIRYYDNNPFGVRYEPWHIKVVKG